MEAYRFDPSDPRRAAQKDILLYYGDFGFKYTFELDGKTFETVSAGVPTPQTAFWIDREEMEEKLQEFMEEESMPWPQIYEVKGWNTTLGTLHDVSGIPFVLLIDGDTGAIIGTARELRGPGLSEYIGQALEAKNGTQP